MANSRALAIVNKFFKNVKDVKDGSKIVEVEVTKGDVAKALKADHNNCVMAVACARTMHADGMIVSISTAYIIKGKIAYRYKLPPSVSREITSFDRGASFEAGSYQLSPPSESIALGTPRNSTGGNSRETTGKHKPAKHVTANIRLALRGGRTRRAKV